jgi:hypothetical protein
VLELSECPARSDLHRLADGLRKLQQREGIYTGGAVRIRFQVISGDHWVWSPPRAKPIDSPSRSRKRPDPSRRDGSGAGHNAPPGSEVAS